MCMKDWRFMANSGRLLGDGRHPLPGGLVLRAGRTEFFFELVMCPWQGTSRGASTGILCRFQLTKHHTLGLVSGHAGEEGSYPSCCE